VLAREKLAPAHRAGARRDTLRTNVSNAARATLPLMETLGKVARAMPWAPPADLPVACRRAFRLEFVATFLLMVAMATIEGGVIAVFAKQSFADSVDPTTLNLMVGLLGAMGELANILSFFWSGVAAGRSKVRTLTLIQVLLVGAIGLIALVPTQSLTHLLMLVVLVLAARVCWSGYITLRPTMWRANYPPHVRIRVVGVFSSVQVLCAAVIGASLAWTLDQNPQAYRVFLPVAACVALAGAWVYSRMRVRREWRLLRDEKADDAGRVMKPWHGPLVVLRVLREDKWYAQFMLWMTVLGFANLTILPTLVISLKEEFGYGHFQSVILTSSIPAAVTIVAIPLWRGLLDRAHVVRFRAVHSWVFVVGSLWYALGAWTDHVAWYFAGAVTMGIGFGGGSLAWNIGHVDFSPPNQTSKYMATHVTLNGVRGLVAPIAVTSAYELLKARGLDAHLWVQVGALAISVVGAAGFVHLRLAMGRLTEKHSR
jgi:MFS family permease